MTFEHNSNTTGLIEDAMNENAATEAQASLFDDIEDISVNVLHKRRDAFCTICFRRSMSRRYADKKVAISLCISCCVYLCDKCADENRCNCYDHTPKNREIGNIVNEVMTESIAEREEEFYRKDICILDRVHVAHSMDKYLCDISGLCGFGDLHWVACDSRNCCIKVYSWKNNTLKRYIRFKSNPYDVTEIDSNTLDVLELLKHKDQANSTSDAKIQDKRNVIGITFPKECAIVVLEVTAVNVIKKQEISTNQHCFSINFSDDKLFIVCKRAFGAEKMFNVCIMTLDGNTLKKVNINIDTIFEPYIAVLGEEVFVTDNWSHRVLSLNYSEAMLTKINEVKLDGTGPRGICTDSQNSIYVAGHISGGISKLDKELKRYYPLEFKGKVNMEKAWALCFHNEKLLVSHWSSPLEDFVTVVGLL